MSNNGHGLGHTHNHGYRGEVPLHDHYGPEAKYAVESEALLPTTKWEEEIARGELPHLAGINTFLKAPYIEDVRRAGEFDVAVFGAPFDGGTTYRSGTRFGPQGIRKISALYGPYSFELGVDLRESITVADLGDIFTIHQDGAFVRRNSSIRCTFSFSLCDASTRRL